MPDNLTRDEENWYERAAKAIASAVKQTYQSDWMDAANCAAESVSDTSFIGKPDVATADKWERICKQCPVALQCLEWADANKVTGVFIAGEWRE